MKNWLTTILDTAADTTKHEPIEVSMGKILDGDVVFAAKDGAINDDVGNKIAQLEMNLSNENFSPAWKLKVPPDKWEHVEVVCDGNALDVNTKPMPDGRYTVKRTVRGYKPVVVVEESVLELREFETTKDFLNWIESLDNDAIEALRQIYYDRWNFDTASQRDRMYYELLDEEKGRRK